MKHRIQLPDGYEEDPDSFIAYEEYLSEMEDRAKERYYEEKYG